MLKKMLVLLAVPLLAGAGYAISSATASSATTAIANCHATWTITASTATAHPNAACGTGPWMVSSWKLVKLGVPPTGEMLFDRVFAPNVTVNLPTQGDATCFYQVDFSIRPHSVQGAKQGGTTDCIPVTTTTTTSTTTTTTTSSTTTSTTSTLPPASSTTTTTVAPTTTTIPVAPTAPITPTPITAPPTPAPGCPFQDPQCSTSGRGLG